MKKVTLAIAMAALVMFAGCKKDKETTGTTLKASIEQCNNDGSKTSVVPVGANQAEIHWTAGDKIVVNNGTTSGTFTLTNGQGTKNGTFTYAGEYTFGENNIAVYPETATINGNTVIITLPAEQNYVAEKNGANPMLGKFTNPENLTFTSLCGVLGISLKAASADVDITAIEVVSKTDEKLNGTFTANATNDNPVLVHSDGGTNGVRFNYTATLTSTAQNFYFALPVGALASGFTLKVYGEGADPIFSTDTDNAITIVLNQVNQMPTVEVAAGIATWNGNLSLLTGSEPADYATATDGMTIYGTLGVNSVKVSIADGANVTLQNATIDGGGFGSYNYAGLTLLGDANITLVGNSTISGGVEKAGVYVPKNKTLTILGNGTINCTGGQYGAGIGGNNRESSGSIVITEGTGTINATGGYGGAGIGGGYKGDNGTIEITSTFAGTVNATGGSGSAGIGSGWKGAFGAITINGGTVNATGANDITSIGQGAPGIGASTDGSCGAITISDGVTQVAATKGSDAPCCIGKGSYASCGTITIGGTEYPTGANPNVDDVTFVYPFQDPELTTGNVTDYQTAGTGHVTLTNAGTGPVTELGLCWGTSSTPTVSNSHAAAAGQTVGTVYDVNINGLTSGTLYYIRGYAKVGSNYYYASNTRTLMLVSSLSDWNSLASVVNNGTAATVQVFQTANISGVTTVVGTESHPFNGTYNGQGYAISNVSIHGSTHVGLFGYVNDASAVIENVVVASGSVSGTGQNVGAVVGTVGKGTVRYCANYAHVSSSLNTSANARVGGIVGWMRSAGGTDNHVEYCINYGAVNARSYVGGIVGSHGAGYVQYCQNYATITATITTAAGIIGWSTENYDYYTHNHNGGNIVASAGSTNATKRYFISNQSGDGNLNSSNTFLNTMTVTLSGNVYTYTSSQISGYVKGATPVSSNPAGITIGGTTYGPTTPAP